MRTHPKDVSLGMKDFFHCLGSCFSNSASTRDDFYILGAYVEGSLRNAEKIAYYLLEEGWFTRELGSVALYRLSHSESLSLELGNETPRNLGGTRVIETEVIQPGSERASEETREEPETQSETEIPEESDDPVGGAEMRRFIQSMDNRMTSVEGGMETFKSETLTRIARLSAEEAQNPTFALEGGADTHYLDLLLIKLLYFGVWQVTSNIPVHPSVPTLTYKFTFRFP